MQYCVNPNGIFVPKCEQFEPSHILDCGQIFRYHFDGQGYVVHSKDKRCYIVRARDGWNINTDDVPYFVNFFDLQRDYDEIKARLNAFPIMAEATKFGHGIRILKQDFFEMIISFIISANNHIPRIKGIIERICESYGQNMGDYYAFPTPAALATADADFFRKIGAGYRAEYLEITAKTLASQDLDAWLSLPTDQLAKRLNSLMGVGPKVADCIMLFGAGRMDVFPVDTWIKKVYWDGIGTETNPAKIRKDLVNTFGKDAGFAQQYLFYMKREQEKKF